MKLQHVDHDRVLITTLSKIDAIDASFLITKIYCEPNEDEETSIVHSLRYCAFNCEMLLRYMSTVESEACTTEGPRDGLSKCSMDSSFSCVWVTTTLELYLRLHFPSFPLELMAPLVEPRWDLRLDHHLHTIQFQPLLSLPSPLQHEMLLDTWKLVANYAMWHFPMSSTIIVSKCTIYLLWSKPESYHSKKY